MPVDNYPPEYYADRMGIVFGTYDYTESENNNMGWPITIKYFLGEEGSGTEKYRILIKYNSQGNYISLARGITEPERQALIAAGAPDPEAEAEE